jgi:hypothetical protein
MFESIESSDRLLAQSKDLIDIGYWNMPDANAAERDRSHRTQATVWALAAVSRVRDGLDPEARQAVDLVSLDLSRGLAADMQEAIAGRRLNPNAVKDLEVLTYPTGASGLWVDMERPAPQRMLLADRISDTIDDATSHTGVWARGGTPEDNRARAEARVAAVSIPVLTARGAENPDLQSAYETAAVGVAIDLSRRVRREAGVNLNVDRMKDATVYLTRFEAALSSPNGIGSGSKGPSQSPDAVMMTRAVCAER